MAATCGLVHLSIDLVFSGTGGGGHVEDDPTDPVTVYGKTMVAAEQLILAGRSRGLHPANFAADGRQLQRPCRGDRLDSIAVQEDRAGHAVLRRSPHADVHRLPERGLRRRCWPAILAGLYHAGGPRRLSLYEIAQSRSIASAATIRIADRLPADRSGADPAASRQRLWIPASWRRHWATSRSIPGRSTNAGRRRIASGITIAAARPARQNCSRRFCTATRGKGRVCFYSIRIRQCVIA